MKDWRERLYDSYVSTGQAGNILDRKSLEHPYFERLIKKHLPNRKDISIADLACGHGSLLYSLKRLGFHNIQGVDISQEQIDIAHKGGVPEAKCQDINVFLEENKDHRFDAVFLMDILEHLTNQEILDLLDKVNNSLKDNGIVVIHVPNGAGIFGMTIRYGDFTHFNAFTPKSIQQVLRACRFQQVDCFEDKPIVHGVKSLVRFVLWQVLTLPFHLLLTAETGVMNHIFSQNMLVISRKTPGSG
jgi:2-polyprenyl-3-methyl-5-hydroxy-6-metoxy-1,4-benzoquinol methylase